MRGSPPGPLARLAPLVCGVLLAAPVAAAGAQHAARPHAPTHADSLADSVAEDRTRLTTDGVARATRVLGELLAYERAHPEAVDTTGDITQTVSRQVAHLRSLPAMRASLAGAGLRAREFVLTWVVAMHVDQMSRMMANPGMARAMAQRPRRSRLPGLTSDNMAFAMAHPDVMTAIRNASAAVNTQEARVIGHVGQGVASVPPAPAPPRPPGAGTRP